AVGADRAPVWPPEVVGSIAHSAEHCVAAVARRADFTGLGVDVEPAAALGSELWGRICTPAECRWIADQPESERGFWVRRFFCAKEAVYKCLQPLTGAFLGFQDVGLKFPRGTKEFTARLQPGARPEGLARPRLIALEGPMVDLRGSWREEVGSLFAGCWLSATC
ncbi:MAG: 4'-phosphopantetheinyl transferase superfamily protein, partial [Planctomycetota bacterium]|nr:4'-phosphopantetheinyl transferase superfamily protein [Planctomycetota bacterium]